MKGKHEQITAFYLETIVLIVSFVLVILVLTNVFGLGKLESTNAQDLTNAVRLAETAAEAFAAAEGPAELADLLGGEPLVTLASTSSQYPVPPRDRLPAILFAYYDKDLAPAAEEQARYRVTIGWEPQTPATGEGVLVKGDIAVYRISEKAPEADIEGYGDPVYELQTGVYIQEAGL